jgi:hypothetical protein
VYQSIPAIIAMKPTIMIGFAPTFVTSACASPAQSTAEPAVAMNVTPVFRADQPSTCCTYSVRMKKLANTTAPSSSAEMFAPVTVRTRKMRNGISGSFARDSMNTNASSSAAAIASRSSVQPEPQPWSGAFDTA